MYRIPPFPDTLPTHAKLSQTPPILSPAIGPTSSTLYITHSMDYLAEDVPVFLACSSTTPWNTTKLLSESSERSLSSKSLTINTLYHIFALRPTRKLKSDYPAHPSTRCQGLITSPSILVQIDKNVSLTAEYGRLDFVVSHTGILATRGIGTPTMLMRQGHATKLPGTGIETSVGTSDLVSYDL